MGCPDCKSAPVRGAMIRWGQANVEVIACRMHWQEIRDALCEARRRIDFVQCPAERAREYTYRCGLQAGHAGAHHDASGLWDELPADERRPGPARGPC